MNGPARAGHGPPGLINTSKSPVSAGAALGIKQTKAVGASGGPGSDRLDRLVVAGFYELL